MNAEIPVIFIGKYSDERGVMPYIQGSMDLAKAQGNQVTLLGKARETESAQYPLESFNETAKVFDEVYRHFAYYNETFARLSFRRWFVLKDFMISQKIERAFVCENDVLLLRNINDVLTNTNKSALCTPEAQNKYDWCSSGHCAYWVLEDLIQFCDFAIDVYRNKISRLEEKWNYHQDQSLPGGVCDMTLFYLFAQEHKIENLLAVKDGSVFDDNVSTSTNNSENEYKMDYSRIKSIRYQNGGLHAYNNIREEWIRLNVIHFSGTAKRLIWLFESSFFSKSPNLRNAVVLLLKLGYKVMQK